jgi:hypothetical protein
MQQEMDEAYGPFLIAWDVVPGLSENPTDGGIRRALEHNGAAGVIASIGLCSPKARMRP